MRLTIILLTLFLAGCATNPPVVIGCNPKLPPEPHYPVQDLKPSDKTQYGKVAKAYVATVQLQHDQIKLRDDVIKRCS